MEVTCEWDSWPLKITSRNEVSVLHFYKSAFHTAFEPQGSRLLSGESLLLIDFVTNTLGK